MTEDLGGLHPVLDDRGDGDGHVTTQDRVAGALRRVGFYGWELSDVQIKQATEAVIPIVAEPILNRFEALVRLLGPEEMTPTAVRQIMAVIEEERAQL